MPGNGKRNIGENGNVDEVSYWGWVGMGLISWRNGNNEYNDTSDFFFNILDIAAGGNWEGLIEVCS